MLEQDFSALSAGSHPWQHHRLFDAHTLQALSEANLSCLEVLLRAHLQACACGGPSPVPDTLAPLLVELDAEQRGRIARCPFSLFSARFNDGNFWQAVLQTRRVQQTGRVPAYSEATRESLATFAREALLCSWHLVRSNPRAARALFGMSGEVVAVFERFTPGRLLGIADDHPQMVTLRSQHFPAFWRILLGSARCGSPDEFGHVQVYGALILAAECFTPAVVR